MRATCCYLSLEEGDAELSQFLSSFISSLQTITEMIGRNVLEVLHSPGALAVQTMIESVLRDTTTLAPFMLVLDGCHLAKSRAVDKAISFLVDHLPSHMHLVMITRKDPFFPWPG